ncbi:MAG: hypothetical protein QM679_01680 [Patulibacter sp.]
MTSPSRTVDGLMVSGLTELALGAVLGWPYSLAIDDPVLARRLGIRSADRLRQFHLDLIALGGLSVLASTALPDLPRRVSVPLGIGAWTNAFGFGVLVLRPDATASRGYRAAIGGSFATATAGFVSLAAEGWRRHRVGTHRKTAR